MPDSKHALVVDDSKSARLVLRRMLERHELKVDTANSAAEALDFLARNRPDVIFMDHMMPGMDGFEAVKAIKNNPATATIPILMYTSKGGDLYLGQARALGAVGILPKTVAPAELFDSLQRLGLVAERRSPDTPADEEETASERAEDIASRPSPPSPPFPAEDIPVASKPPPVDEMDIRIRKLLDEQRVEIRKDILVSMESVSRHVGAKLERDLEEKLQTLVPPPAPASHTSLVPGLLLVILLFLSLGWNYSLHMKSQDKQEQLLDELADRARESGGGLSAGEIPAPAGIETDPASNPTDWSMLDWAINQSMQYPFDEIALDEERLQTVETLLERLTNSGFSGTVVLETHAGEFCLMGDEELGFKLPPPDITMDQCDFIGNPVQPADTPATHQSLAFANFRNSTPWLGADSPITLEVVALPRSTPLAEYPPRLEQTTAMAWNQAAEANNRVRLRLLAY